MTDHDAPEQPMPEETPAPKRGLSPARKCLLVLLLAVLGVGGYIAYDAHTFLMRPAATDGRDITLDIAPGATFDRVAWDLRKAGALSDVFRFRLLAQLRGKLGAVQAGEFTVNTGWTPERLLAHLTSGRPNAYRLTLREGLPWWEVARLVEEGGFAAASDFEAVIHDPVFLRRYGIPFANAEGFLYPETYLLRKPKTLGGRDQAEKVARILVETFWKRTWPSLAYFAATDAGGTPGVGGAAGADTPVFLPGFTLHDNVPVRVTPQAEAAPRASANTIVPASGPQVPALRLPVSAETLRYLLILASLVEKETGVPEERARVAGVYANRMRLGMLLQCDPTIIYGLGKTQSGPIRRSQLEDAKNPYNTYKHPGLPPGPICSPGASSTLAAMAPEKHAFLYFVATGEPEGTHTFSANLRDHQRAVTAYRAAQGR